MVLTNIKKRNNRCLIGVSANKIGISTNRHGLKCDKYGTWFNDKAKGHSKEVQSFRYYSNIIPVLKKKILKLDEVI